MKPVPLFIGTTPAMWIGTEIGAHLLQLPSLSFDLSWSASGIVENLRSEALKGRPEESVVVAVWHETRAPSPLLETDLDEWLAVVETPFALWFTALSVAAERCADGGHVVAIVDRPEPMASEGWGAPAALADAVEITERSLCQLHGHRGVRFGLVTVDVRLGNPSGLHVEQDRTSVIDAVGLLLSTRIPSSTLTTVRVGPTPT